MLKLENVATPLTAATLVGPDSVALPGLTPSATVTVPVKSVATLPWASRAVTCTAGVSAAPAAPFVGCTVNASCVAAAADTVKGLLVALVGPAAEAVSVYRVPALLMLRFAKLATPFVAASVVVPVNVPATGLLPSATVTVPVKPATAFPSASCAVTCTAGEIGLPAVAVPGWLVNASCVAVPGVMENAALAAAVRPAAVAASV